MVNPEEIRSRLEAALPGARVAVADTTGAGDHFEVEVAAAAFAGKTLVEQHQLVYGALGGLMPRIHALSLRTAPLQEKDDERDDGRRLR
jgi:stress-induced morphogen